MDSKYSSIFTHNYNNFTKKHLSSTADKYGLLKKEALESHIWVYELYSHIQKRSSYECVLKGGACAQLYLPIDSQRCTADIDIATSLTPHQLDELLHSIRYEFNMKKFYTSYSEYVPEMVKLHGKTIPMMTYMFNIPFIFKGGKRKKYPSLKIDFLFADVDRLDKTIVSKGETLGLKLNYSPVCTSPYSLICDKLLTFAKSPIGLEGYKIEGFYKNVYDLFYLLDSYNDIDNFKKISSYLSKSASMEFQLRAMAPLSMDDLLEDILFNLYNFAIADIENSYENLHHRIIKFQDSFLQEHMRKELNFNTWSIMTMYLYIWTNSLKNYLDNKDFSGLTLINEIISQYEEYLLLDNAQKRNYLLSYRNDIYRRDSSLNLKSLDNPLRLIYLYNIILKL